jgi:hypothetical protein
LQIIFSWGCQIKNFLYWLKALNWFHRKDASWWYFSQSEVLIVLNPNCLSISFRGILFQNALQLQIQNRLSQFSFWQTYVSVKTNKKKIMDELLETVLIKIISWKSTKMKIIKRTMKKKKSKI